MILGLDFRLHLNLTINALDTVCWDNIARFCTAELRGALHTVHMATGHA